jgi:signal transduction histidine kinase
VVIWALPAAVSALGVYLVPPLYNKDMSIGEAFIANFIAWGTWALWVPIILWLGKRFPLEPRNWIVGLGVHLPASLIVGAAEVLLFMYVLQRFRLQNPEWGADSLFDVGMRYFAGQMLVVYWAIVGAHAAIRLHEAYRTQVEAAAKLEADLANAQLHALRAQLNPHFLFNALNSVVTLIGRDTQGAQRMIVRLSELLRATLAAGDGSEVQLKHELELVERYLDLERIRFGDRLSVSIDIAPELMSAIVPALLLQPLVENAITHGISQISTAGLVTVRGWTDRSMLHLEVRDNGPGLLAKPKRPGSGIGVTNLRARLERLYGDEQSLELLNAPGGGCIAAITLPAEFSRNEQRAVVPAIDESIGGATSKKVVVT